MVETHVSRMASPSPILRENDTSIIPFQAWKMLEIHLLGVAVVIHNDDFHIVAHGNRVQTALQQVGNVLMRNDN